MWTFISLQSLSIAYKVMYYSLQNPGFGAFAIILLLFCHSIHKYSYFPFCFQLNAIEGTFVSYSGLFKCLF